MNNRMHLTLTLTVFFLTATILLFGWVYLDSINKKYNALLLSPQGEAVKMSEQLAEAEKKIAVLNSQVTALQDSLPQPVADAVVASSADTDTRVLDYAGKVSVFADPKCFEDTNQLDQCVILSDTKIADNAHVIVKPAKPIASGTNKAELDFYQGKEQVAEYTFDTDNLLFTDLPIADVVFINRNDITIQIKTSPGNKNTILNYDGFGWIEYTKNLSRTDKPTDPSQ